MFLQYYFMQVDFPFPSSKNVFLTLHIKLCFVPFTLYTYNYGNVLRLRKKYANKKTPVGERFCKGIMYVHVYSTQVMYYIKSSDMFPYSRHL